MNTKIKSKKAFSLIEVLVSVLIISVVGTILFKISTDSKKNYIRYKNKISYEYLVSTYLFMDKISNTNLYEQLRDRYRIDNFDIRQRLKNIKLEKKEKDFSKIKMGQTSENGDNENSIIEIQIKQIQIFDKNQSSIFYSIGI